MSLFQNLGDRLNQTFKKISGQGRLTEKNISQTLRDVRVALLEADVALQVVKDFIKQIRERALGQEVSASLNPGQALVKIVQEEMTDIIGGDYEPLNLQTTPPAIILTAGLQGAGKTTTVAKLARYLHEQEKKKVLMCSTDVYRPAAIEQLQQLAKSINVEAYTSTTTQDPVTLAKQAIKHAKKHIFDVLILDTAGRLHIDDAMMSEIKQIHHTVEPIETLFIVDSMTGQDAANTAKAFDDTLPLTGVILTKTDGDARGGAALSIRHITGKPIKFMGVGEKTDALETFHPDRIVSRILGMGDVLTLIEEVERKIDQKQAKKTSKKIMKGQFDLADYRQQLQQVSNMGGGITSMLGKIPGVGNLSQGMLKQVDDTMFTKQIALINSMTPNERRFPDNIKGSRKRRIINGSGSDIQTLNRLLKQFRQMQKMLKKMGKPGGMKKAMRNMQNILPPDMLQ